MAASLEDCTSLYVGLAGPEAEIPSPSATTLERTEHVSERKNAWVALYGSMQNGGNREEDCLRATMGSFISGALPWGRDSCYVEPFAGTLLGVGLCPRPVRGEIVNDGNGIRSAGGRDRPKGLGRLAGISQTARPPQGGMFEARDRVASPARRALTPHPHHARTCRGTGTHVHSWGGFADHVAGRKNPKSCWRQFQLLADRLRDVGIEHGCALELLRRRVDIGKAVKWRDLPHRSADATAYTYADVDTYVLCEPLSVRRGQVATSGYRDKWGGAISLIAPPTRRLIPTRTSTPTSCASPCQCEGGQVATLGYRDKWGGAISLIAPPTRRLIPTRTSTPTSCASPCQCEGGQVATLGCRDKWSGAISPIAPPTRRLIPTRTSTPTSCASPCRCEGDRLRPWDTETSRVARSPSSLHRCDGLYLRGRRHLRLVRAPCRCEGDRLRPRDTETSGVARSPSSLHRRDGLYLRGRRHLRLVRAPVGAKGTGCDLGIQRQVGLPGMEEDRENHKMGPISTTTQFRGSEWSVCRCVSTLLEPGNERFSPPSSNGLDEGSMLPLTERGGRK